MYILKAVLLILAGAICIPASAAVESAEALERIRDDAMTLATSGERVEAARLLLNALRDVPPDRVDLAYPAVLGTIQHLLFINEYLMTPDDRTTFHSEALLNSTHPMDRFMNILMWYTDDYGLTQDEANRVARELRELAHGDHEIVRIGALFVTADPYYYKETPMALDARDRILARYPENYLAQEAQRLSLYYYARRGGAEALRKAFEQEDKEGQVVPHAQRLQHDAVGSRIYEAIRHAAPEEADAACVAVALEMVQSASRWSDELAALNVIAGFTGPAHAEAVEAAATIAINRASDPRCVFRALAIRLSAARKLDRPEDVYADVSAMLQRDRIPVVADRMNLEDLMNGARQSADYLAQRGRDGEAASCLNALAVRFANTALAAEIGVVVP